MTVEEIRVSWGWLALREPADAAARAPDLVERLGPHLPAAGLRVIHDLGCGTGGMGRWLAPLLSGPQHWVVHDRDADLLDVAAADLPGPAADGAAVTVEARQSDITRLQAGELDGATLITASALLDMLTRDELAGLVSVCTAAKCPVLLTLSVVGRVELTPEDPLDARVAAAFDAHQRREVDGRRLLGPDAVAAAVEQFGRLGADVHVRPSPWRLGALGGRSGRGVVHRMGGCRVRAADRAGRRERALQAPAFDGGRSRATRRHRGPRRPAGPPPSRSGTGMSRSVWTWARLAGVAATFAVLVWRLGTGPFIDGVRTVDGQALAAAAGIAVIITVCCAWRWKIVARGLGIDLPLPTAVGAYYRSQFLNVTLPGGVVGDVHRGYSHGREVSDVSRGLRAVAWERSAGQVVQAVLTVVILIALPSPVRSWMPVVAIALGVAVLGILLLARVRPAAGHSRWTRVRNTVTADIRDGLLARRSWLAITLLSAVALGGSALTFMIAARTAGADASVSRMLPLALLVMLAMVLPSVAGWGPREGATAWAFAAAGLGADRGVATAVVYGIMVFVASLPGAAFLVLGWFRRTRLERRAEPSLPARVKVAVRPDGAPHA